jgi:hypothetical protein
MGAGHGLTAPDGRPIERAICLGTSALLISEHGAIERERKQGRERRLQASYTFQTF